MLQDIKNVIEDYERRLNSATKLMSTTPNKFQYERVSGKKESYQAIIHELQQVVNKYENSNPRQAYSSGQNDPEKQV